MISVAISEKVQKYFGKLGYRIVKNVPVPTIWQNNKEFLRVFQKIKNKTLVTADRCFTLFQFVKQANLLEGDIAEIGVYKGGTAKLIALTAEKKKIIHLFDTFLGMPEADPKIDLIKKGEFSDTSLLEVKGFFKGCENVKFYPGLITDTSKQVEKKKFCLVNIDVDNYIAINDCLHFFYPRMVRGGMILIDDYGWKMCPGVKKAVSEFLVNKKENPIVISLYQCLIIKH